MKMTKKSDYRNHIRFSPSHYFLLKFFFFYFCVFWRKMSRVSFENSSWRTGLSISSLSHLSLFEVDLLLFFRFDSSSNADLFVFSLYSFLHTCACESEKNLRNSGFPFLFFIFWGLCICVSFLYIFNFITLLYTVHITVYYYYHDLSHQRQVVCMCCVYYMPSIITFSIMRKENLKTFARV
jgi:hypothetical protein